MEVNRPKKVNERQAEPDPIHDQECWGRTERLELRQAGLDLDQHPDNSLASPWIKQLEHVRTRYIPPLIRWDFFSYCPPEARFFREEADRYANGVIISWARPCPPLPGVAEGEGRSLS